MYSSTRFQQLLSPLPADLTAALARQSGSDRYVKRFDARSHLVAMLHGQLSGARSLRELVAGFAAHAAQHYHLRASAVRRSTLADANRTRSPGFFKAVLEHLMCHAQRRDRRELAEVVQLLDSTPIQLKGRGFEWCDAERTHRTQGQKVHMVIDAQALAPRYLHITAANVNDITDARSMTLIRGVTYVMDKGYCDYGWWHEIDAAGARFVTRLKRNAHVRVLEQRPCAGAVISEDALITLGERSNRGGHRNAYWGRALRRIRVERPGKAALVLVSNDLQRSVQEIAALYKQRWQIELFFKWLKQHLSVKRFLGRSANAVHIQLYTALIAYLLLWLRHQHRHGAGADAGAKVSLHLMLTELRATLGERVATRRQREWCERRRRLQQQIAQRQGVLAL